MPETDAPAAVHAGIPNPLRGALWILLSCACFSGIAVLIRHVSSGLHPFEIVFFRNLFGLAFMVPWFLTRGRASLRTDRPLVHGLRALSGIGAMLCWFTAVTLMPLAEATALSFVAPLFATAGAAAFLGEQVGVRRWAAIAAGFAGAMVILRPGVGAMSPPALLVLLGACFTAATMLLVKTLSRQDSPGTIVLYMGLLITPISALPAVFVWQMPSVPELAWLVAIGLLGTIGHIALARAFAVADATAVMPVNFSRLIFAALLGYAVFGERPDGWTWVGAGVIFSATVFTAHREARLAKRRPAKDGEAPPVPLAAEKSDPV
ncbi:MAG: DMT family transporter [Proteobacteria bacterium]|nr:DMT family transporter [Pseudomonadota bacterium]